MPNGDDLEFWTVLTGVLGAGAVEWCRWICWMRLASVADDSGGWLKVCLLRCLTEMPCLMYGSSLAFDFSFLRF